MDNILIIAKCSSTNFGLICGRTYLFHIEVVQAVGYEDVFDFIRYFRDITPLGEIEDQEAFEKERLACPPESPEEGHLSISLSSLVSFRI